VDKTLEQRAGKEARRVVKTLEKRVEDLEKRVAELEASQKKQKSVITVNLSGQQFVKDLEAMVQKIEAALEEANKKVGAG